MSKLTIPPNQHVLIAGRTGSGKTWMARKYLANYNHVIALDTKGLLSWPEIPGTVWGKGERHEHELLDPGPHLTLTDTLADLPHITTPKIIYRPKLEELNEEYINEFFRFCYHRENTIVWIDEAMSICPSPYKIPYWYQACLTRGRQKYVACWSLTQRPSGIPQIILSESSHFFIFDLNLPTDREKLANVTGCNSLLEKPGQYLAWYYNVQAETATRVKFVERRGNNG